MIADNFIKSISAELKWLEKLVEYRAGAIKSNVSEIQTRTTELGVKIKASLTLQDKTEITDFIREYSTKLVQLEEQLTHAKVNFETIEQRSEG